MKKLICMLLCFVIVAVPVMSMAVTVEYNGTQIEFPDVQPEIKDGAPVLPLRAVFEASGAGVYWEETDRMIMAQKNGAFIILQIGSSNMFVGSENIDVGEAPYIQSDRTMVNLKTITEALGVKAEWNAETSVVSLTE